MDVKSLSATSISLFEDCEAAFKATYVDFAKAPSNKAASLGSACHLCLENMIKQGMHLPGAFNSQEELIEAVKGLWLVAYRAHFSDDEHFKEGWDMILKWIQEMDWTDREVVSLEEKKNFMLPTSIGDLKINYIIDRLDKVYDHSKGMWIPEVVDYKSVRVPITPDKLKNLIQARLYALATFIEYKAQGVTLPYVWVTFDLLRYNKVSHRFSREECIETWNYLVNVAEKIIASTGERETINKGCLFCVRNSSCKTLLTNAAVGGALGYDTIQKAGDRLAQLEQARSGIEFAIKQLQEFTLAMAEREDRFEWESNENLFTVDAIRRRDIDSELAKSVLGEEIASKYGRIGVTQVDTILKTENLDQDVVDKIKALIQYKYSQPRIVIQPKTPFSK